MKKTLLTILFIGIISIIGFNIVYASENKDINSNKNTHTLSEVQLRKLSELEERGQALVGSYLYQQKVITGEIEELDSRLDLQTVQEIILNHSSFNDMKSALKSKQAYPDFAGGSGVSILEYWLDDAGNEKIILICEQQEIYYTQLNDDGSINVCEKLYAYTK